MTDVMKLVNVRDKHPQSTRSKQLKKAIVYLSGILVIGVMVVFAVVLADPMPKTIQWAKSFDQALKLSADSGKIVMVDFYAEWCGACKQLDSTTYKDKSVIAESRNLIDLKVDTDKSPELSEKYGIRGLPTIVFMDSEGGEITRYTGYMPPKEFIAAMREAQETEKGFRAAQKTAKEDPDNVEAHSLLATNYYQRRKLEQGATHLKEVVRLDPENKSGELPQLYMQAGLACGKSGDFPKAIEFLSQGASKYPASSVSDETRYYLGISYKLAKQTDKAKETFKQLTESAKSSDLRDAAQEQLNDLAKLQ